eukprot:2335176-Lingulodinium_polyedra.AAC.1
MGGATPCGGRAPDRHATRRDGPLESAGGVVIPYKSDGLRPLQVPTVNRRHLGSYLVEEAGPP